MMNAAIYARVSTYSEPDPANPKKRVTRRQDPAMQLSEVRTFAERMGFVIVEQYVDAGVSGTKASRPALDKLMTDATQRKFDCVLVYKLDRFGRSVRHVTDNIARLDSLGIRFMAVTQGLDTDRANPTARFMLHVLAAVAEFERELIRERVVSGLAQAREHGTRSGKPVGAPKSVFDRAKAAEMRAAGQSYRQIGKVMGVGTMTVHAALKAGLPLQSCEPLNNSVNDSV